MLIGGYGQGPRNRVLDAILLRPAALGASAFGPSSDCPRLAWRLPTLSSGLRSVSAKLPEPPRHPHPSGSVSARASWVRRLWLGAARVPQRLVPALTPMRARFRVWPAANAPRPVRRGGLLAHNLIGARSNALFLVAHSSPPIEIAVPGHSAHGGSRCLNPRQGAARRHDDAWSRTNPSYAPRLRSLSF